MKRYAKMFLLVETNPNDNDDFITLINMLPYTNYYNRKELLYTPFLVPKAHVDIVLTLK